MRIVIIVFLISISSYAQWPVDNEPYGFLGCKQLKYRGLWESIEDTIHPDEAVSGVCISVALGNVMMYYQWPLFSRFDGIFLTTSYDGIIKHIDRRWNYQLITGPRTTSDCGTDDPSTRHAVDNPSWTGIDEMRRLLYSIERSFGFDHNFFKTKDSTACHGEGYYGIEHVLRNRFGYPNCKTLDAFKKGSRTAVVRNLKKKIPVIAMRCDHIYLLDGYKFDEKKQRDMIHSSDFIQDETSFGWFPWKAFYAETLDRFVVDVYPWYTIPKGPDTSIISYFWGDGYIPGTKYTQRRGRLFIFRDSDLPLGKLEISIQSVDLTPYAGDSSTTLYHSTRRYKNHHITIPAKGYIDFDISEAKKIDLIITNKDPYAKNIRVMFCDLVKKSS